MSNNVQYVAVATAVGVLGGAYCAYRVYQGSKKRLPENWTHVGTLTDLCVYPVKSCRGVPMEKVECTFIGPKSGWLRDRVLMVVDEEYNFITGRVCPELFGVQPSVRNAVLTLTHPDFGAVHVDLAEVVALRDMKKSSVWGTEVPLYDCGKEVSEWITKVINNPGKKYHLAYYASLKGRDAPDNPIGKVYNISNKDTGALTDDTSYHLINEGSVDELNTRLKDARVTTANFRPNFVVSGPGAFDEDKWKFVKIGENVFEIVMPCGRCAMTTVDPDTGVRDVNSEPLTTLRSYRLVEGEKYRKAVGQAPRMGVQMALRSGPGGVVCLNDAVYVA